MPELRWFWMTSLPETAAKAAKQLWKGKAGMDLRITKPRKPEWLAQNLGNPFRGWDGAEHIPVSAAKKAGVSVFVIENPEAENGEQKENLEEILQKIENLYPPCRNRGKLFRSFSPSARSQGQSARAAFWKAVRLIFSC